MPISENETLFNLIGTTYGGDGQETFGLPNLESRVPVHFGNGPDGTTYTIGEQVGVESVTLSSQQIPSHTHTLVASNDNGAHTTPAGNVPARPTSTQTGTRFWRTPTSLVPMDAQSLTSAGGSQPHENNQPFLVVSYIISLFGVFPSQT
jgi:microcystin-dependent protein